MRACCARGGSVRGSGAGRVRGEMMDGAAMRGGKMRISLRPGMVNRALWSIERRRTECADAGNNKDNAYSSNA